MAEFPNFVPNVDFLGLAAAQAPVFPTDNIPQVLVQNFQDAEYTFSNYGGSSFNKFVNIRVVDDGSQVEYINPRKRQDRPQRAHAELMGRKIMPDDIDPEGTSIFHLSAAEANGMSPPLADPLPCSPHIILDGPIAPAVYKAPATPKFDYSKALHISQMFFDVQRSGKIPAMEKRLAWRSDSLFATYGTKYNEDLSGAWYEAANTMKWGLPLATTIQAIGTNIYRHEKTLASLNELNNNLKVLKMGSDYLIQAHPQEHVLVGQLGVSAIGKDTTIDFGYYNSPEYYEKYITKREHQHPVIYITKDNPAGEVVAASASALAVAAVVFKQYDPTYSDLCVKHAKELLNFSILYPESYNRNGAKNDPGNVWYTAAGWYESTSVGDDQALAAFYIYKATGDKTFLNQSITIYSSKEAGKGLYEQSWSSQGGTLATVLFQETKEQRFLDHWQALASAWIPEVKCQGCGNRKVPRTKRGLAFSDYWGTLALTINACDYILHMALMLGPKDEWAQKGFDFCAQQANYILGESGYVFLGGFTDGLNTMKRPNHVSSYNPYDEQTVVFNMTEGQIHSDWYSLKCPIRNHPRVALGAVPSGPDEYDRYQDDHRLYQYGEPTQDASAPMIGFMAGMIASYEMFAGYKGFEAFTDCTLDLGFKYPNATKMPAYPADNCYNTCNKPGPTCSFAIDVFGTRQKAPYPPVFGGVNGDGSKASNTKETVSDATRITGFATIVAIVSVIASIMM